MKLLNNFLEINMKKKILFFCLFATSSVFAKVDFSLKCKSNSNGKESIFIASGNSATLNTIYPDYFSRYELKRVKVSEYSYEYVYVKSLVKSLPMNIKYELVRNSLMLRETHYMGTGDIFQGYECVKSSTPDADNEMLLQKTKEENERLRNKGLLENKPNKI
jgi:hypothetical protein